jgi:hypothetical protein
VKRLIKNLFQLRTQKPPAAILNGFADSFHDSINIEWSKSGRVYEALFYDQEIEKIARFDKKGNLLEVRTNIAPSSLSEPARSKAFNKGEIMNVIKINRENKVFYEVIVRENPVKRILLLLNDQAEILAKKVL